MGLRFEPPKILQCMLLHTCRCCTPVGSSPARNIIREPFCDSLICRRHMAEDPTPNYLSASVRQRRCRNPKKQLVCAVDNPLCNDTPSARRESTCTAQPIDADSVPTSLYFAGSTDFSDRLRLLQLLPCQRDLRRQSQEGVQILRTAEYPTRHGPGPGPIREANRYASSSILVPTPNASTVCRLRRGFFLAVIFVGGAVDIREPKDVGIKLHKV